MTRIDPANHTLFGPSPEQHAPKRDRRSMTEELPRIDGDDELRQRLLPYCRLQNGDVWEDPEGLHRVAVADATNPASLSHAIKHDKTALIIADPPYNVIAGARNTATLFQRTEKDYHTDNFGEMQQAEARRRRAEGATLKELARSYNVGRATISRLPA